MGEKSYCHQNSHQHFMQHQNIMERKDGSRTLYLAQLPFNINVTIRDIEKTQEILFFPRKSPRQHISDNYKII